MVGHHSRLRDMMSQSYLICACTRANHARCSLVGVTSWAFRSEDGDDHEYEFSVLSMRTSKMSASKPYAHVRYWKLVFLVVLVLRSKGPYFAVARNIVKKVILGKKTWQVESVEHIEQYHIKFVETSHYLKRHRRKAFEESLFLWS